VKLRRSQSKQAQSNDPSHLNPGWRFGPSRPTPNQAAHAPSHLSTGQNSPTGRATKRAKRATLPGFERTKLWPFSLAVSQIARFVHRFIHKITEGLTRATKSVLEKSAGPGREQIGQRFRRCRGRTRSGIRFHLVLVRWWSSEADSPTGMGLTYLPALNRLQQKLESN
jgi:hypothetical protein